MQLQLILDLPLTLISTLIGGGLAILGSIAVEVYRGWVRRRKLRRILAIETRKIMQVLSNLYEKEMTLEIWTLSPKITDVGELTTNSTTYTKKTLCNSPYMR